MARPSRFVYRDENILDATRRMARVLLIDSLWIDTVRANDVDRGLKRAHQVRGVKDVKGWQSNCAAP